MPSPIDRNRRALMAGAVVASLSPGTLIGCGRQGDDRQLRFRSLSEALDELARLTQAKALTSKAAWNWAQTLAHCAQSIEYAMTGFPAAKSMLFQSSVGSAAFTYFTWRGRMSHDLAEPIPGAPPLAADTDAAVAEARLRKAVEAFQQWTGPLHPHFAYGALSKPQYELANAMHLANHFSMFHAKA